MPVLRCLYVFSTGIWKKARECLRAAHWCRLPSTRWAPADNDVNSSLRAPRAVTAPQSAPTGAFGAVCLLIAASFALGLPMGGASTPSGRSYYASPHGSDADSGSIDKPWRTVNYSVAQLSTGDALYLRGGTYYEHDIRLNLKATA